MPSGVEELQLEVLERNVGVRVSRYTLWAVGSLWSLGAVIGGPWAGVTVLATSADAAVADVVSVVVALSVIALGLGVGLAHFVAAWGLGEGRRWGWVLTSGLGAFALIQCCVPVGAILLWGTLNPETRALFAEPPPRP